MKVIDVVKVVESIFPKHMAANTWDNVGLLIGDFSAPVQRILVTNDFTRSVLEEIRPHDFVLSYHPPIFQSLKRLVYDDWKSQIVLESAKKDVSVYSPHTSVDAIFGGINDWLCTMFIKDETSLPSPIENIEDTGKINAKLYCTILKSSNLNDRILNSATMSLKINDLFWIEHDDNWISENKIDHSIIISTKPKLESVGYGRFMHNIHTLSVSEIIAKIKKFLGLNHVRVAFAEGTNLASIVYDIAVCAGAGGSMVSKCIRKESKHRVLITGELTHHQLLQCIHNKHTVVLCEHSNTERKYLQDVLIFNIQKYLNSGIQVVMSKNDKDPITIL